MSARRMTWFNVCGREDLLRRHFFKKKNPPIKDLFLGRLIFSFLYSHSALHLLSPSSSLPHLYISFLLHRLMFRLQIGTSVADVDAAFATLLRLTTLPSLFHYQRPPTVVAPPMVTAAATSAADAAFATRRRPPLLHKSASPLLHRSAAPVPLFLFPCSGGPFFLLFWCSIGLKTLHRSRNLMSKTTYFGVV